MLRCRPPAFSAERTLPTGNTLASAGVGALPSTARVPPSGQVIEGGELGPGSTPQRAPQPVRCPGAVPNQVLMRPGQDLDALGRFAVSVHRCGGCAGRCGPDQPTPSRRRDPIRAGHGLPSREREAPAGRSRSHARRNWPRERLDPQATIGLDRHGRRQTLRPRSCRLSHCPPPVPIARHLKVATPVMYADPSPARAGFGTIVATRAI